MATEYSLYEAKARLSALVRQVREGRTIVITVHGEPAAELRPVRQTGRKQTLDERHEELASRGLITPARMSARDPRAWPAGPRKRGALKRFLGERD